MRVAVLRDEISFSLDAGVRNLTDQVDRLDSPDEVTRVQDPLAEMALDSSEFMSCVSRIAGSLAVQHGKLHLRADKRLDDSVVQFARDTGPLHRHGSRTQAAQAVHVVDRRPHLLDQLVKETELSFPVRIDPGIEQEEATAPLFVLPQNDRPARS